MPLTPTNALAVIVAGGFATRMAELGSSRAKALLPVAGRPVLAHQIDQIDRAGISEVRILAGHLGEQLVAAAAELRPPGLELEVLIEDRPQGSGGCLRVLGIPTTPLVVIFGDILFDLDLRALLDAHRRSGARVTAVVHPNEHPHDCDLTELDERGRLSALHRKPHDPSQPLANLAMAALFVLDPSVISDLPPVDELTKLDLVQDVIVGLLDAGDPVFGWRSSAYIKDMGTPERYAEAEADYARGLPARRRGRRPTIVFDGLDALVRAAPGPVAVEPAPGLAELIRALNRVGVQVVVSDEGLDADPRARALDFGLGRAGAFVDHFCAGPEEVQAKLLVDSRGSVWLGTDRRSLTRARAAGIEARLVGPHARSLAASEGLPWSPDLPAACWPCHSSQTPLVEERRSC